MKNLKSIMVNAVLEAKQEGVEQKDISAYLKKFDSKLSENMKVVILLSMQYNISTKEQVEAIVAATKAKLKTIASELQVDVELLSEFQKELKAVKKKNELNQMPQMVGPEKVAKLLKDGEDFDENTMDFSTQAGQTFIVKKYTPQLKMLVNKWDGKSSLDKEELWSIAYSALTYAMQTYNSNKKISLPWALGNEIKVTNKDDEQEIENAEKEAVNAKGASFKTYLTRCVDWAFKYEMNRNSRVVRRPASEIQRNNDDDNGSANFDMSIDTAFTDQDAGSVDHYKFLGVDADSEKVATDVVGSKVWADFLNALKKNNSERDVMMFMKAWGIGGNEVMSKTDIAKMFNVSQPYVSKVIKKILTEIQSDKKYKSVLMALKDTFMENFGIQYIGKDTKTIVEALRENELYIMIEDITNRNRDITECLYNNFSGADLDAFGKVMEGASIEETLNRALCVKFLNHYDIFENHSRMSDSELVKKMREIFD